MKTSYRSFSILAIAVILADQPHTQGVIIVSNLAEPNNGSGLTGSDHWFAQGFRMPNDVSYTVDSVSLKLASDPTAPNLGTFTVSLWDATGPSGSPGTQLATVSSGNQVSSLTADPTFTDYPFTP